MWRHPNIRRGHSFSGRDRRRIAGHRSQTAMSGSFREGDTSRTNAGDIVHSNGEFVAQGHRIGGARLLVDGLLDREDETARSDRAGLKLLAPELKARVIRRA